MANWLRCQGFHATVMRGPFQHPKGSELKISAGFIPKEHGGRPLWWGWLPWTMYYAQNFEMFFDASEKIIGTGVGYTYE